MTVVEGLLFDVDYVTLQGKAWLRLFVRANDGMRVLLDPGFEPYFYAVPDGPAGGPALEALARRLENVGRGDARVVRCEVVSRLDGLAPRAVLRVVAGHPQHVPQLRELVASQPGVAEVREADVLYAQRFLIDKALVPMAGVRAEVEPGPLSGTWAVKRLAPVELEAEPELKTLAFDLEVYNPRIVPDPDTDPIILIGVATSTGRVDVLRNEGSDKDLIEAFVRVVREADPDVLFAYNGDAFDWPYLLARCAKHGIRLAVGRDGSEPEARQAGMARVVQVSGRANVDLLRVAQRDLPEVKVKTLVNVAEHLGVVDRADRVTLPKERIWEWWDAPEKREELVRYSRDDVTSTLELGTRLLPLQAELCRVIRVPLDDGAKMGRGRQVDWFLLSEAARRGMLAPKKELTETDEVYEGGFVLEPPRGLQEEIVALDFSSMYPSIMLSYNISPETLIAEPLAERDAHLAPEVGHRFRKAPDGFFRQIVGELVERRRALKRQLKRLAPGSAEASLLDVRQKTLKVLTNSFYGYMAWAGARWYKRECAEATAAWGRHFIKEVIDEARRDEIEVLYGDTDSLFVRASDRIPSFVERMNERLPLELDLREKYRVIFFTGAKKRYAGLTTDGEIVVRGLEVRRGDWCELAKRLQERILETLLRKRDAGAALRIARQAVQEVNAGGARLEALTIHKTLTQAPGTYKSKQAHVLAVERAQREHPDFKAVVGSKVSFVFVKERNGKAARLQSERAKLVMFLRPEDELDLDYYVDKQLVPVALRVLEHFGYSAEDVKGSAKQQSLQEWF